MRVHYDGIGKKFHYFCDITFKVTEIMTNIIT